MCSSDLTIMLDFKKIVALIIGISLFSFSSHAQDIDQDRKPIDNTNVSMHDCSEQTLIVWEEDCDAFPYSSVTLSNENHYIDKWRERKSISITIIPLFINLSYS